MQVPEKLSYTKPKLIVHGTMATITQGSSSGSFLDQNFPAGTLFTSLTFS